MAYHLYYGDKYSNLGFADPLATQLLRGVDCGAAAAEGIKHQIAIVR